jgi:hypothetical protein
MKPVRNQVTVNESPSSGDLTPAEQMEYQQLFNAQTLDSYDELRLLELFQKQRRHAQFGAVPYRSPKYDDPQLSMDDAISYERSNEVRIIRATAQGMQERKTRNTLGFALIFSTAVLALVVLIVILQ